MRWEPLVALIALLFLGGWLVFGGGRVIEELPTREGAHRIELRAGVTRGVLERNEDGSFRLLFPTSEQRLSEAEVERMFGGDVLAQAVASEDPWLFRLLNITTWGSLVWVSIGLFGQVAFFLRMAVQWLASERQRASIVPESFWWLSLIGGVMLFSYFVWRRDIIGVLGQTTGVVVYARNLRLIHKQRQRGLAAAS